MWTSTGCTSSSSRRGEARKRTTLGSCAAITRPPGHDPDAGTLSYVAENALLTLHLGTGRYAEALAPARTLFDADPPRYGCTALPDVIEAAVRGGDDDLAERALVAWPSVRTRPGRRGRAGVLARLEALSAGADAEGLHLESIELLAEYGCGHRSGSCPPRVWRMAPPPEASI